MKGLILLICVGLTLAVRPNFRRYEQDLAEIYFEEFIVTHNKHYNNEFEKLRRFEIFKKNLEIINKKNEESQTASFGVTIFSDLTLEEFLRLYTGLDGGEISGCDQGTRRHIKRIAGDESFDWREKNVVSRVKNQGRCGSCWAFGATGNLESQYALKHNKIVEFSEQQLVDCDFNSKGCCGTSNPENPFVFWIQNGAMTEEEYAYNACNGICKFDPSKVVVNVTGCVSYHSADEDRLKDILREVGPLAIGIDASGFSDYHGGIYDSVKFNSFNHEVLLVGYGSEEGVPYWTIKNSWAETFGESGYIRLKRGINACGIAQSQVLSAVIS